jgi:uncharacterized protein (DUF885 family)
LFSHRRRALPAIALLLLSGPVAAGPDTPLDAGPPMERLIERYTTDADAIADFYRVPLSGKARSRTNGLVRETLERLAAVDFEKLDQDARVDYVLLRHHLEDQIGDLAFAAQRAQELGELLPFAGEITALEEARRALEPLQPRTAADTLERVRDAVAKVHKRVESGLKKDPGADAIKPSKVVAYRAARNVDRLRKALGAWFGYRNGYEPDFGWWVRKPHAAAKKALEDYAKLLRERVAGVKDRHTAPLIGDPIGSDELARALAHEMIPYTAEQLITIAEQQFAWCEAEGRKASEELGFGGDWKKAVEHVKGLHAAPGEQDDLVAGQSRDAIAFVEDRELVTVPDLCKELWRLEMISADGQKTLPFAAYGGNHMMVAYPTDGMEHASKLMSLRGNNEHFTRIVTPHELIPGHHLQKYVAARSRTHRRTFGTPFLVEGWALHWEMLLWDQGYARGPEDRIGMLFWRKHRCARIIVSLGFHLGTMKPDEMIAFLTDRVGLEKDGATSEVRRYIAGSYGPLYQCAYMIGGLQIRALRKELVESGKMTDRAFHDAVLRQNSVPIEMIRAALTDAPLTRDFTTEWAFAGKVE